MKVTEKQLKKINDKVKKKYSDVNVAFVFYNVFQAKYTEIVESKIDVYYFALWNSIIANEKNFEDVYYSI